MLINGDFVQGLSGIVQAEGVDIQVVMDLGTHIGQRHGHVVHSDSPLCI
jgi:hypothetical protein